VVHFEIDPSEVNKIIHADVAVLGDAKEALQLLLPKIKSQKQIWLLNQFPLLIISLTM
jgi:acetolactate synthase-1/2/3 large subunit